ncbi:MAG: hypothetical protein AAF772_08665 [Acidobacteriota bacterium]
MPQPFAEILVLVAGLYAALGLVFAVPFAVRGAPRVDPAAQGGTWGFRLLIVPGAALFWPLLARRWFGGHAAPPVERTPHRAAAEEPGS